jgi:hypothetical protein
LNGVFLFSVKFHSISFFSSFTDCASDRPRHLVERVSYDYFQVIQFSLKDLVGSLLLNFVINHVNVGYDNISPFKSVEFLVVIGNYRMAYSLAG